MRRLAVAFLLVVTSLTSAVAAPDQRAADILTRAKEAMGGAAWDGVRFVRTKLSIETSGLTGAGESFEDARTGAHVDRYDLGVVKGASGYDGENVWRQDASGQVALQGGDDPRQAAVNEAYRRARAFWYPDRAQADIALTGDAQDGADRFHVLRITPRNGRPFDLWVNASTFRFDRIAERNGRELVTTFFTDYRSVEGKLLPFASRQTNGQARYDTLVKVDSVAFETDAPRTAFAPPAPPRRDFGFARGARSTTIPFKLINNHIYLEVRLNGRPSEFLFDTGGLNVITPTVARAMGLSAQGAVETTGSGEGSADAAFTTVDRMEVGGAWLENQSFVVIGLESFGAVEGRPITGIVGYEIFKRFVVVLDYENERVTLIEPDGYTYRGRGARVAMELNERTPEVAGEIDGVAGKFTLDTGSRATLSLMAPFVASNNLVQRYGATYQGVTGWGVGGPARSWIVRGGRFAMGGAVVDAPIVELSQATRGSFSDTYRAGNVGAGILKQFNIVWDYPRHQIFFERNSNHGNRDVFDRAGFWVNLGDAAFDVVDVIAGGPADAAGLRAGDRIMTVNGRQSVSELSLPDFRLIKKDPASANLTLDVQRGAERLTINITLRDLV